MISAYGRQWNTDSMLQVELLCFKHGITEEQGGLGKAEHFWNVVHILWPVGSRKGLMRNPWSDKMIDCACEHQFLSVSGPASASKSETFAAWALVNYLSAPLDTCVLVTSTSLKDSRKRIWGSITDLWLNSTVPLWGKLVDSVGMIRADWGDMRGSDRCGVHLISGERKKEKDSIGKLVGIKNNHVILIGDELPELSAALIEAGVSNLQSNPKFQFVGIGNPNSRFDTHGTFSEPKAGWKTITEADLEWETNLGYAIRFDGERSPNILEGRVIYPFLPTQEKIDKARRELGESSLSFWRMWKGFWCPEGASEGIYSDAEITIHEGDSSDYEWVRPPTPVAGLDLAFTNGGDQTRLQFGLFGRAKSGYDSVLFTENVLLSENTRSKVPRNEQIITQILAECQLRGVEPGAFGLDVTAGGSIFAEMLAARWGNTFHKVNFSGTPTENTVLQHDGAKACDLYYNRVSELWGVGLTYLRSGQLRGIRNELAVQMTSRKQVSVKSGENLKLKVETKAEMKKRGKPSPDIADSAFILLDVLRDRFKFRAAKELDVHTGVRKAWRELNDTISDANSQAKVGLRPSFPGVNHSGRPGLRIKPVVVIGGGWGNSTLLR